LRDVFSTCSSAGSFDDLPPYSYADPTARHTSSMPDLSLEAKDKHRRDEAKARQRVAKAQLMDERLDKALLKMGL
jgi:hypothetical protein